MEQDFVELLDQAINKTLARGKQGRADILSELELKVMALREEIAGDEDED